MNPFVYTRRVEFCDTDLAGIMHFANYFRFMEAAETAFLRERGLSVHWSEAGVTFGFPRVSVACDFAKPVKFEEELRITVIVEKLGTKSIHYRFEFRRAETEIALGRMTAVFCRAIPPASMESIAIPESIRAKLSTEP